MYGKTWSLFLFVGLAVITAGLFAACAGAGTSPGYKVSGAVWLGPGLQWNNGSALVDVPADTYDLYAGVLSTSLAPGGPVAPGDTAGYVKIVSSYDPTSTNKMLTYTYNVSEKGDYYVFAFLDVNKNGVMDMEGTGGASSPMEPFGMYPVNPDSSAPPAPVSLSNDLSGADIQMQSGFDIAS